MFCFIDVRQALALASFLAFSVRTCLSCDLYLMSDSNSSTRGTGRTVVAGINIKQYFDLPQPFVVEIEYDIASKSSLMNYVFASQQNGHSALLLGIHSLFNHADHPYHNIDFRFVNPVSLADPLAQSVTRYSFTLNTDVLVGEQLFINYGHNWFPTRSIDKIADNLIYSLADMEEHGHCLTNVFIASSTIPCAGYGLFAAIDFRHGEIVTLSPMISVNTQCGIGGSVNRAFLPDFNNLLHYCVPVQDSSQSFVPVGSAALVNHKTGTLANVVPQVRQANSGPEGALSIPLRSDSLPVDGDGASLPLDLILVATKYIEAGDEIAVDYTSLYA